MKYYQRIKARIKLRENSVMVEIDTDGLAKQNKDTVDLTTLAADTPEVISRQVFFSSEF